MTDATAALDAPDAGAALRAACAAGDAARAAALLDGGASPASVVSALIGAVVGGHGAVVELLLARGAPVDGAERTHTPLRAAALHGRPRLLARLLKAGADARVPSAFGRTPLMGACFARDGVDAADAAACVALLLADARGRETLETRNDAGESALDLAELRGDAAIAALLADAGATRSRDADAPR
jgi:ankyrin repeat protein